MRIGMVVESCHKRDGAGRGFAELGERLAARGHQVTLYAARVVDLDLTRIGLRRLPVPPRPAWLARLCFLGLASASLARSKQDVVCALGTCCLTAPVVRLERVLADALPRAEQRGLAARLGRRLSCRVELWAERRLLGRGVPRVLVTGEAARWSLEATYPRVSEQTLVIPNGVDHEVFSLQLAAGRRAGIRQALGLEEAHPVALFVGGNFQERGLSLAVDTLGNLPELSILVLGGQADDIRPYREQARALGAAARLFHIPHTNQPAPYYAAADLFLLPSAGDGFPLSALEAAATGLPLVLGRARATRELLGGDNGAGLLVEPDAKALTQALEGLVRQPARRDELGRAAHAMSLGYAWDPIVRRFEAALAGIGEASADKGP